MGKIVKVDYSLLVPGEDHLSVHCLASIIKAEGKDLLPVPIRKLGDQFLHMDGRHRLIWNYLKGNTTFEAYLCDDWSDRLHNRDFPNFETDDLIETNNFISRRWDSAMYSWFRIRDANNVSNYVEHFRTLQERYPYLSSKEECISLLSSNGLLD